MSGRPKRAAATPEEEREQLRQLTRELHEAAQDARAAARELLAARDQVSADAEARITEIVVPLVNGAVIEINGHLETGHAQFQKMIDGATDAANRAVKVAEEATQLIADTATATDARLVGYESPAEVAGTIMEAVRDTVQELVREPGFIEELTVALHHRIKFALA